LTAPNPLAFLSRTRDPNITLKGNLGSHHLGFTCIKNLSTLPDGAARECRESAPRRDRGRRRMFPATKCRLGFDARIPETLRGKHRCRIGNFARLRPCTTKLSLLARRNLRLTIPDFASTFGELRRYAPHNDRGRSSGLARPNGGGRRVCGVHAGTRGAQAEAASGRL
jgi:hypothetical protein